MKVFVTGVGGQLGHDIMNELQKRGHEGVGSDLAPVYSGIADGSAVTTMPYVSLDITDKDAVERVITEINPDAVDPEDVEMLQDMVVAAVNEAMRKAEAEASQNMAKLTGGLNLGGLF